MPDIFDSIFGQPQVREFLRASLASGNISHAYLFTGPAGSNKTTSAYALAQAIICENRSCGECEACKRIMRRKHPDVRYYEPGGLGTYLIEQVREIVADTNLAPIQARKKIYILDRVDLLGVQAANAFLKTLEEPPANVIIILLGRTRESVLPTIVSRCQVVPFRHIPAQEAAGILVQNTGASELAAKIAVQACGGSITKAMAFLKTNERMEYRDYIFEVLEALNLADDWDILNYVSRLVVRAKAPLDEVRLQQEEELTQSSEFLEKSSIRQLELRNKRSLGSATKDALLQTVSIIGSWLRDVMMVCSEKAELIINQDKKDMIVETAMVSDEVRAAQALLLCKRAEEALSYNVSPETCLDALLYEVREVLYGANSSSKATV